ncbi:hypothetical protein T440DRAFT_485514 [Plenodomus tracheiphilus IPT5]|uniref:Uncharacterized protein n=1 Tax=Plenodomus tracheiphilus IPT5 TaxID=1408161 RepID=A0A6A7BLV3_9PLEO|nr:hypothetical protein T440DRAFT_485514 [Plenodomus tracheiphilus IPT5]
MQRKIKAVLRSSRRNRSPSSRSPRQSYESSEASSPRAGRHSTASDGRGRASLDYPNGGSLASPNSPSVSAAHDSRHSNGVSSPHSSTTHNAQVQAASSSKVSIDPTIAKDYQAYLPALAPTNDAHRQQHVGLGDDRRHVPVERAVADRSSDRNRASLDSGRDKPLPKAPDSFEMPHGRPREQSIGSGGHGDLNNTNTPEWKVQQRTLLDGVVDLRDTVDVEKETTIAPAVVHEVIKPHEHEVIQHKIYREIHNYSYYHRLQPVMQTEVLPPRHFIPNPNGEGLIEITADELPSRTGQNRWWEIMQKQIPQTYELQARWRTEPEVIHGETYITEEGFERKETTIIHPPTLEDMTDYDGVVQPVHFDHKTGERWLGEVTTMSKLREQHDNDALTMRELTQSLPEVPDSPTVKRKPVGVAM